MIISEKSWKKYTDDLRKISTKAASLMAAYLETHEHASVAGRQAAINYAVRLVDKYGDGAAEKACQMYDAVALASGKNIPPAEPSARIKIGEVAQTVNGASAVSERPDMVGNAVSRLVKMRGVDTTMTNALRDGAEWAWIPQGDTCPFCLMLASNGWRKASKKAIRNGHAEHIHPNCDCTYAIRFDSKSNVAGYDPGGIYDDFMDIDESGWGNKVNYMRRKNYEANKDTINAQKRAAYAKRMELKE